jgi:hypothetical protein
LFAASVEGYGPRNVKKVQTNSNDGKNIISAPSSLMMTSTAADATKKNQKGTASTIYDSRVNNLFDMVNAVVANSK